MDHEWVVTLAKRTLEKINIADEMAIRGSHEHQLYMSAVLYQHQTDIKLILDALTK